MKIHHLLSILILVSLSSCNQENTNAVQATKTEPIVNYKVVDSLGILRLQSEGPYRILELEGKKGVNATSINTRFQIPWHTINLDSGALTLWFFSLEELSPFPDLGNMGKSNPNYRTYPLLADHSNPQLFDSANFKLVWDAGWHPSLTGMFAKGNIYEEAFQFPHRALVTSNHMAFQKEEWYQITLTWNKSELKYRLYVNGVLVGAENQFYTFDFQTDHAQRILYFGNPTLCYTNMTFYNDDLENDEVYALFRNEVPSFNSGLESELKHRYAGENRKTFDFELDAQWEAKLDLDFSEIEHLDQFYVQGIPEDVSISEEGLLIETINKQYNEVRLDSQVYVWTNKVFEGDLYVEYEFKSLRRGGLSLLMTQASGMNREDFMIEYPLRTSGSMSMVCWEDVRNYHWEYFREMADVRNDVASSALMKNPFMKPLDYGCMDKQLEPNKWHKLQFLQRGNRIIGAIDGGIMIDAIDDGMSNTGPVLNSGRIAIRCMLHTKMVFKNFKVYNKKMKYSVTDIK